jgi:hypothetical protein
MTETVQGLGFRFRLVVVDDPITCALHVGDGVITFFFSDDPITLSLHVEDDVIIIIIIIYYSIETV